MKFLTSFFALTSLVVTGILADHFYTIDPTGEAASTSGYHFEGVACYVASTQVSGTTPIYRWYSGKYGHFYTADPNGELAPQSGYQYEGIAFYIFPNEVEATIPFYRWLGDGHFYSTNVAEGNNAGFKLEGIAGYVYSNQPSGFVPLFRWYNNK